MSDQVSEQKPQGEPATAATVTEAAAAESFGPLIEGHNYDGIQEYDNPTPGWWNWLFIGTIVFSIGYFFIAITTGKLSAIEAYKQAEAEDAKRLMALGEIKADAATLLKFSKNEVVCKIGAAIFQTRCVTCHGRYGEGVTGPNLTDNYYINVKKIEDIYDVVSKGRGNGAMPAWSTQGLSPQDMVMVSAYVASLRGQNKLGKPVEPNAVEIDPWTDGK